MTGMPAGAHALGRRGWGEVLQRRGVGKGLGIRCMEGVQFVAGP